MILVLVNLPYCLVKQKFRMLCTIMRVSYAVQQCLPVDIQVMEFTHSLDGFKLVSSVYICILLPSFLALNIFGFCCMKTINPGT